MYAYGTISKIWKIYLWKFCILSSNIYLFDVYLFLEVDNPGGEADTCPCSLDDLIHEFEKCGLEDHEMQWATRLEECVLTESWQIWVPVFVFVIN